MKTYKLHLLSIIVLLSINYHLFSCKSKIKDTDIQASVNEKLSSTTQLSNVSGTVTNGVLTLNGQCPDQDCVRNAEQATRQIKGVTSVVNNITIVAAAPAPPPAPVEIAGDDVLTSGVRDATKDYPGVKAEVRNGEISLSGDIKRSELPRLMMSLNSLKPRKINNNLNIK